MSENDYDELSAWQDVLDDVMNGHGDGLECPFCGKKPLEIEDDGGSVRVTCKSCGRWIEGQNAF